MIFRISLLQVEKVLGDEEVNRFKRELAEDYPEYADTLVTDDQVGSADDDEGFFDEEDDGPYEIDDSEYQEETLEQRLSQPGPFDDLFTGQAEGGLMQGPRSKKKASSPKGSAAGLKKKPSSGKKQQSAAL